MTDRPTLSIHYCPLAQIDSELQREYSGLLDAEERSRLAGFRAEAPRLAFLVSRALLRSVLAQTLNCAAQALQFRRDHHNKPQLEFPAGNWHFNLSHSGAWVALALSNIGPVGVDVECHERHSRLEAISKRFFSVNEHHLLMTLPEPQRQQRFFELWTLKEAYVKALGRGIATAMAGTDIEYLTEHQLALHLHGAARCEDNVHYWHYALEPTYSLALALIAQRPLDALAPLLLRCVPLRGAADPSPLQPLRTGGLALS
jgi:4'-phosphopantetheinyl transferase